MYHLLHTVCCSEARALRLGCWEHIILRITDLIQQVHGVCTVGACRRAREVQISPYTLHVCCRYSAEADEMC